MVPGNVVVPDEVVPLQFPSVVDGLEGDVTVLVRFPFRGEAVLRGARVVVDIVGGTMLKTHQPENHAPSWYHRELV